MKVDKKTNDFLRLIDDDGCLKPYHNSKSGRNALLKDHPDVYSEMCGDGKVWGTEPVIIPESVPNTEADTEAPLSIYEKMALFLESIPEEKRPETSPKNGHKWKRTYSHEKGSIVWQEVEDKDDGRGHNRH